MTKDVFISHSSRNSELARSVCAALEAQGIMCWIAPRDIVPGQSWGASIVRALDECPVLVLVLTADANESNHVAREVERADGKSSRIITFRVDDVTLNQSLEYFLSADHWLDATSPPVESHFPALLKAVKSQLNHGRATTRAATLAPRPKSRPKQLSDGDLVRTFDELAPDNWSGKPQGKFSRFLQNLFTDQQPGP